MKIYRCDNCRTEEKSRKTGVALPFWGVPDGWLYGYTKYDEPASSFAASLKNRVACL